MSCSAFKYFLLGEREIFREMVRNELAGRPLAKEISCFGPIFEKACGFFLVAVWWRRR